MMVSYLCVYFLRKLAINRRAILSNREMVASGEIAAVLGDNKPAIVLVISKQAVACS